MVLNVVRCVSNRIKIENCFFCSTGGVATRRHTDNSYYSNARYHEESSDRRDT